MSLCRHFRDNAVTGDIPLISLVFNSVLPPLYLEYTRGTSGIYLVRLLKRLCSSPPLLGFHWNRWGGGGGRRCLRPQCLQFTNSTYTNCLRLCTYFRDNSVTGHMQSFAGPVLALVCFSFFFLNQDCDIVGFLATVEGLIRTNMQKCETYFIGRKWRYDFQVQFVSEP